MISRFFFELRYLLGRPPWDSGIAPPELQAFLAEHPPGRAIDLGCGTGTNLIAMAERGWEATGIDFSAAAVRRARRRARRAGLHIRVLRADVTRWGEGESPFDLALDIGCFHSLPSRAREIYTDNAARLLRPGGTLLLYSWLTPNGDGYPGATETEIETRFAGAFTVHVVGRGTDRGGRASSGWFALTRLG